jgi:uncharacterized protein YegJ (DUF2314 family)
MKVATLLFGLMVVTAARAAPPLPTSKPPSTQAVHYQMALYFLSAPTVDLSERVRALQSKGFSDLPTLDEVTTTAATAMRPGLKVATITAAHYRPPDERGLRYAGRGVSAEQGKRLQSTPAVWTVDFSCVGQDPVRFGQRACEFMLRLVEGNDALIWDETTREVFSPEAWKSARVDGWEAGIPYINKHITIHLYQPEGASLPRAITLGMEKFACPDVVMSQVPRDGSRSCGNLMNAVCQTMVEKGPPDRAATSISLDLRSLKHTAFRQHITTAPAKGATQRGVVGIAPAKRDEGDPDNRLIELTCEGSPGDTQLKRQQALLEMLFGAEDHISAARSGDAELLAARDRARKVISEEKKKAFLAGLPLGDVLLVKAPFKTPDGGVEWMWVEVVGWKGEQISGILQNRPELIPTLKAGSEVVVAEKELFDYLLRRADGSMEGNETGQILQRRETEGK